MLTADLALSWQRGRKTGPRYIDAEDAGYRQVAADLIDLVREHRGGCRAELEEALAEYIGVGTDYKILRGLIKLLLDRCSFETVCSKDPAELRRALFFKARERHPVTAGLRQQIIAETAAELACAPDAVLEGLYADLPENQRLTYFDDLSAQELLDRYNLAQAQALLYRCVEMRLQVEPQEPAVYRGLFGAIKAYRLIHTIKGRPAAGYEIRLDGPVSMFHRSQKYGIQMAVFLPALLLYPGWRMQAEITSKMRGKATFELSSNQDRLRSHYLDEEIAENPLLGKLIEAWGELDSAWTLQRSQEVIDLGESAFIPDLTFCHAEGKRVHLEILGYWTPKYLSDRLKEFARADFKDYLVAASDEMRCSRDAARGLPANVIIFKKSLTVRDVKSALEQFVPEAA
jgi:hypothetical protein